MEKFYSAIYGSDGSRAVDAAPGCSGTWNLTLGNHANVRRVRRLAPEYLQRLEAAGLRAFWVWESVEHPEVERIWKDLRIESGTLASELPAGQMILNAPGGVVSIHSDSVVEAVTEEVSKPDNVRKLRAARADEAHLFVFVNEAMTNPREAMLAGAVPLSIPPIPDGVARVWIASRQRGSPDHVVWSVTSHLGWQSHGLVPLPELPYPAV